jgi:hypothetical protein
MSRVSYPVALILVAALTRLLPHPANVTPVTAIALFGAVTLGRRLSFLVPLAAMLLSDAVIGFHSTMLWVYASFAAIVGIGFWYQTRRTAGRLLLASLVGSTIFYGVTNFGVWIGGGMMYPQTLSGLLECYTAALPFYRNTLLGDLVYSGVLFGAYELLRHWIPSLQGESASVGV